MEEAIPLDPFALRTLRYWLVWHQVADLHSFQCHRITRQRTSNDILAASGRAWRFILDQDANADADSDSCAGVGRVDWTASADLGWCLLEDWTADNEDWNGPKNY